VQEEETKRSSHSVPCVLPHAAVKESGDDQCCIEQSSNDNSIAYLQDADSFSYCISRRSIQVVSISALKSYSDALLVQTTICADQYETVVDLVRLCEDKSSVRTQTQCENYETRTTHHTDLTFY
jgi:hypothetical protein